MLCLLSENSLHDANPNEDMILGAHCGIDMEKVKCRVENVGITWCIRKV